MTMYNHNGILWNMTDDDNVHFKKGETYLTALLWSTAFISADRTAKLTGPYDNKSTVVERTTKD